jgi:hypothetical protein
LRRRHARRGNDHRDERVAALRGLDLRAFDPPTDHLAVPWAPLGALALVIVGGAGFAAVVASNTIRRMPLGAVLREE